MRRKTMRTVFLAAAALSLGLGSAYAGEIEGIQPNTYFQQLPGVIAQAPAEAPPVATAQNGQAVYTYVSQSNRGTVAVPGSEPRGRQQLAGSTER
jgi:hypothetical protein